MSIDDMPAFDLMAVEHEAWIEMVNRLHAGIRADLPADVNDDRWNPFVDQLKFWGESLVALRATQEPKIVEQALRQAREHAVDGRPT